MASRRQTMSPCSWTLMQQRRGRIHSSSRSNGSGRQGQSQMVGVMQNTACRRRKQGRLQRLVQGSRQLGWSEAAGGTRQQRTHRNSRRIN
jgi:hypothetical protein